MNDRSPVPPAREPATPLRERMRALAARTILDAAEEVLVEQGPRAGMDAIALRAGVAVGTLYKHFSDREGLLQALFEARVAELLGALDAAGEASAGLPFEARLEAALQAIAGTTERHAAFRRMAFQADLHSTLHPTGNRLAIGEAIAGRLEAILEAGRQEGRVAEDPDHLLAPLLLGLVHSALIVYLRFPERLPADRIATVVARQFLHGAARP